MDILPIAAIVPDATRRVKWRYLNYNSLDLIEADFVAPAIVELCRARRGVVGHGRNLLQGAAIL